MSKETIKFDEKEYRAYEVIAKKMGFKTVEELVNYAFEEFVRNELIEKEAVTVQIPKKLLKLVQVLKNQNWEKYLSDVLTDSISADVESEAFGNYENVMKDFGLAEEFRFYKGH